MTSSGRRAGGRRARLLPRHAELRRRGADGGVDILGAHRAHRVDIDAAAAEEAAGDAERLALAALVDREGDALDGILVKANLAAERDDVPQQGGS